MGGRRGGGWCGVPCACSHAGVCIGFGGKDVSGKDFLASGIAGVYHGTFGLIAVASRGHQPWECGWCRRLSYWDVVLQECSRTHSAVSCCFQVL
jgi:hypothetical protein